ncbi:MAG: DNA polymerase Y family protein [Flavitalea sp.]
MAKRFISIWFRSLNTDWFTLRHPELKNEVFVLSQPDHGRVVVSASNIHAQSEGIYPGMAVADARAIVPGLKVMDDDPQLAEKLLLKIARWCIRFTPVAAVDGSNGIILDVSGCAHLWGGESPYITNLVSKLKEKGYRVRAALGDTIGIAWAVARFGTGSGIIPQSEQAEAIQPLPPESLRISTESSERLHKLGLKTVSSFFNMPRSALRRRFGAEILLRLDQLMGFEREDLVPVEIVEPWQERLPCLEPISTATGISIALERLLDTICKRLGNDGKGIRKACFKSFRVDGMVMSLEIGTHRGTLNTKHLFKLFEEKLSTIEPGLGIELFVLETPLVEDLQPHQEKMWESPGGLHSAAVSELIDRVGNKVGADKIHRYLPAEHHWPERSLKQASSLEETTDTPWKTARPRPVRILQVPESIGVAAPIPDYPPMLFRYRGKVHKIRKADGPERIEREWWLEEGEHRDYYSVEDEDGKRYWLFRSGHYSGDTNIQWFIHGFFA